MKGIYCIKNKANNKVYVGKSCDIEKRWRVHRSLLRRGRHVNIYLQHAWDKYGEENFEFEVLECVDDIEDKDAEMRWITLFNAHGTNGYNLTDGGEGQYGRRLTEEQKKHLSEINRGERNPSYGLKRSAETRKRMSESMKRAKRKPHTEEHKRKASESMRKNKSPILWVETGQVFHTLTEAAKASNIPVYAIQKVCAGKRESTYKQHFMYKEE